MVWKRFIVLFFGASSFLCSPFVFSLSFSPTDIEWQTWPDYCRARYVASGAGKNSSRAGSIPVSEVKKWKQELDGVWYGFHHYCAALTFLTKGLAAKSELERERALKRAIGEAGFTRTRSDVTHPMMTEIVITIARANRKLGRIDEAIKEIEFLMEKHPSYAGSYSLYALIERDQGRFDLARDILLKGNSLTGGRSAEIQYFLGLTYFDLKDFSAAQKAADEALKLGYPLLGLKKKLEKTRKPPVLHIVD